MSLLPGSLRAKRNVAKADALHQQAIEDLCHGDVCAAEQVLNDALILEPGNGAIHNTLGKTLFLQRKYYQAAWEFEKAQTAMPSRPEPLNNLGLVYEAVDDLQQAIQYYEMAWAMEEDNPEFLGNLLRARIRSGDYAPEVLELLRRLVQIDHRNSWVDWAKKEIVFWNSGNREIPDVQFPELGPAWGEEVVPAPLAPIVEPLGDVRLPGQELLPNPAPPDGE